MLPKPLPKTRRGVSARGRSSSQPAVYPAGQKDRPARNPEQFLGSVMALIALHKKELSSKICQIHATQVNIHYKWRLSSFNSMSNNADFYPISRYRFQAIRTLAHDVLPGASAAPFRMAVNDSPERYQK